MVKNPDFVAVTFSGSVDPWLNVSMVGINADEEDTEMKARGGGLRPWQVCCSTEVIVTSG